jgi:hypothetical protein
MIPIKIIQKIYWQNFRSTNDLPQCLSNIDTEEGHLLIENFVNTFFVTSLSVSLHNLLDFYNLFCLCCIVMSRRSVTHKVLWLVDSLRLYIYIYVWKLNQTVLELDIWADKFVFFPWRNLNSHHWYTTAIIA